MLQGIHFSILYSMFNNITGIREYGRLEQNKKYPIYIKHMEKDHKKNQKEKCIG